MAQSLVKIDARYEYWLHMLNHLHKTITPEEYERVLECFWSSQLMSKRWLVETLRSLISNHHRSNFYIYGGWYGVLGQFIADTYPLSRVTSVDLDPKCEDVGQKIAPSVLFVTKNMTEFTGDAMAQNEHIVSVNTSCEHITQEDYDLWLSNRKPDTLVVLQSNNFFQNPEHVRCHATLDEFIEKSHLSTIWYAGEKDVGGFNRYMIIGYV